MVKQSSHVDDYGVRRAYSFKKRHCYPISASNGGNMRPRHCRFGQLLPRTLPQKYFG